MSDKRFHICLVAGARPNFMKIAPILERIKTRPDCFSTFFVHTGQHYDHAMSKIFFEDLGMPRPDLYMGIGSGSHAEQTAKIMSGFEDIVLKEKPELVLVVGDVNSTLACALVASKLCIPVAHVEAGLRSRDRRMPEEINRLVTDQLSDLLFTTCAEADENLINEGIAREKIHFTGNVMIESLMKHRPLAEKSDVLSRFGLQPFEYGLITLHRPSNVDDKKALKDILGAFEEIQHQCPLLFPVHPRTKKRFEEFGFNLSKYRNLIMCEPLGYIDFTALEMNAKLVFTDSGGIQEETTYFGVPCLTLRENTERAVTIYEGTNELVGVSREKILTAAERILKGEVKKGGIPEKWDDKVSGRIVNVLEQALKNE